MSMDFLITLFRASEPLLPGLFTAASFVLVIALLRVRLRAEVAAKRFRRSLVFFSVYVLVAIAALLCRLYWPVAERFTHLLSLSILALAIIHTMSTLLFDVFAPRRSAISIPSIIKTITMLVVFLIVVVFILSSHGISVTSLVTTSAVFTAIIGFALQDLLSSVISGLAIQMENPFREGNWVKVDQFEGVVREINWRSTKLETRSRDVVIIPNNTIIKSAIVNFSRPSVLHRRKIKIGLRFSHRPGAVHDCLTQAALSIPEVLHDPPPQVIIRRFVAHFAEYELIYFIEDVARRDLIDGNVHKRIWYHLDRAGLRIPLPAREVYLREEPQDAAESPSRHSAEQVLRILRKIPVFAPLSDAEFLWLAAKARTCEFEAGEPLIHQGDKGVGLNIIGEGEVDIIVHQSPGDPGHKVSTLSRGAYFGERALLTGDPASADALAVTDCLIYQIDKNALAKIFEQKPEMAELFSQKLEQRDAERTELLHQSGEGDYRAGGKRSADEVSLASRIRNFFQLNPKD
ncbi:MAG: mechanosensitive ion channel [Myxococcales bacterium]|jgi:small-conductance mechanosensitive channel/CRP-like cAMP-binding protein|nr:mechanosensitive ion channel [Myxococcales bacterium]